MARVKRSIIQERTMAMLCYLADQSKARGAAEAVLSLKTIGNDCTLSRSQVRLVMNKLKAEKLLVVESRVMPNGGSAENAYRVTSKGLSCLQARPRHPES